VFRPLVENLRYDDPFLVCADYASYVNCQEQVSAAWQDRESWTKMSILNTARSGNFSSDRAIAEYCDEIWNVWPLISATCVSGGDGTIVVPDSQRQCPGGPKVVEGVFRAEAGKTVCATEMETQCGTYATGHAATTTPAYTTSSDGDDKLIEASLVRSLKKLRERSQ
jgi:hypothetical protein